MISPIETPGDARLLLELRELEQQLKIAREAKLLEQQEANRELIRNLAHEIKNPLGGIRGAAQLLERELADPELREFTQVIVKETDRLQSLMNRLLTPNRLPRVESLNIHEVMERVRTLLHGGVSRGPRDAARLRHRACRTSTGDKEQPHPGDPQRGAQRRAGDRGQGRDPLRHAHRAPGRRSRKQRYRHAIAVSIEDDGPGVPAGARRAHLLSAGERARRRHGPGPVARAELRAASTTE